MPKTTLQNTDFTLYAVFCLSRLNLPVDPGVLGRLTGKPHTEIASDLLQLGQLGRLASGRAGGMRLTMLGLARAAKLEPMVARTGLSGSSPRVLHARMKEIKPLVAAKPRSEAGDDVGDEPTKLSA